MRYLLLVAILLTTAGQAQSQTVQFSARMKSAVADIAHLRYSALEQKLAEERKYNPGNRVPDYLEAAAICIELFINEDEEGYNKRAAHLDQLISRLEDLPAEEKYRDVFLGEIYLGKASLQGKFRNSIKAGWLFYKAYGFLQETADQHPDFVPNHLPWGVLNAAIGSLPEDYRSIASFLGFKGDISTGLKLVKGAYQTSVSRQEYSFYQPYFGFVYAYINHQLDGTEKVDLFDLGLKVKESSFYIYLQSQILLDEGRAEEALSLLENRPEGPQYLDFPYLDYITGKVALSLGSSDAPAYFKSYLRNAQNPNYFKSTYRYLAWHYLINNNFSKAAEMQDMIFEAGEATMGADQQAIDEAQRGFNPILIKARLSFDAGKYNQLIKNLDAEAFKECCTANWEKLEFYYRKGRAFQELGLTEQAIAAYFNALQHKDNETTYALGNSMLQLATLYEEEHQHDQARKYYQMALNYKGYPFYEGIHQKAKTGLSRVR